MFKKDLSNHQLMNLTSKEFQENSYNKAVLAVGSTESHGDHLPEGTDTFVSYILANKLAEKVENLLVLPPITVGYSKHYQESFPFTLSLSYDTTISVIYDILESTLINGINRIIIINGHDGNIAAIEVASRKIKEKYKEAKIVTLEKWWEIAGDLLPEDTFEVWKGLGHGGEGESSIAYYLFPDLCIPENAKSVIPDNLPNIFETKWTFNEITNSGQTGDARKASIEKGKLMTDVLVDAMAKEIISLDKRDWDYTSQSSAKKFENE